MKTNDEKEACVTGTTEEEKKTAKKTTYNSDKNAENIEIIHKYKGKWLQKKKRGILLNIRKQ